MLKQIRFIFAILRLARNPQDTNGVFLLGDTLINLATKQQVGETVHRLFSNPNLTSLYLEKSDRLRATYNVEKLNALAPNTLGFQYSQFMKKRKLEPEFYKLEKGEDEMSFLQNRLRKTHDIWHVLTGFDTDIPGELGLQAFYFSQLELALPLAVLVAGFLHMIKRRDIAMAQNAFEQIIRGYKMGQRAKKIYGVDFEARWGEDLGSLRLDLNIA